MSKFINFLQKRIKKFSDFNAIKLGNRLVKYSELSSKALSIASVLLKNKASKEGDPNPLRNKNKEVSQSNKLSIITLKIQFQSQKSLKLLLLNLELLFLILPHLLY